jgi:hypothetical protein
LEIVRCLNCGAERALLLLAPEQRAAAARPGLRPRRAGAEQDDNDDVEDAEGWGSEEEEEEEEEEEGEEEEQAVIIPMPGQVLVSVGAVVVSAGVHGFQDGAAAAARFGAICDAVPDRRARAGADYSNHRICVLSADLQQVSTVAGDGEEGHRDGAAAQPQFLHPHGLAL